MNSQITTNENKLTFGGHLEVLRQMLFRVIIVIFVASITVFCCKDITFNLLLAPSDSSFITYDFIENILSHLGANFHFDKFSVDLIATTLSSQFMTHITTSIYLGTLFSSPYILFEVFRFVSPALYKDEKKYSILVLSIVYVLFVVGILMSYFVLFPISFRFLGTYNVAEKVHNSITLDSYISTFTTLSLLMGLVFQLPIISYTLARFGFIEEELLITYRKHAFLIIMLVAAFITPPDILTLVLVSLPLYLLYESSIWIIHHFVKK